MTSLESLLYPTQAELFTKLRKEFKGKTVTMKGSFILVRGEAPIMLVAHLDTVHETPVKHICKTKNGTILMSPQGIGGDDRCGVYALVNCYETAEKKPWLLFTCDEEIGGIGADKFVKAYENNQLPKNLDDLKLIIEIDRRGQNDAVYYECDNKEFEDYITSKGFKTASGSFSDISYVAPALGVAAVNLSSGYYNAHTLHEYINRKHIDATIGKVNEIIKESVEAEFPKFEYIQRIFERLSLHGRHRLIWESDWGLESSGGVWHSNIPKDLSAEYVQMYDELLDYYDLEELEAFRKMEGDKVIADIYENDFGGYWNMEDLK